MMKETPTYILSIDQGTTGTTAIIVNSESLELIDQVTVNFPQYYPHDHYVEHDLQEIWKSVGEAISKVIKKSAIPVSSIASLGITNQRETTCAYDKSGQPLNRAIVWQDQRTVDYCQQRSSSYAPLREKTGLPLNSYFSASKMRWLLEHNEKVKRAYKAKNLRLSTIDSYLLYRFSDGQAYSTDVTNASRTLLMSLDQCQWDQELLDFFNIDKSLLPEIQINTHHFGTTKNCSFLPDGIPILCLIGDQQASLLGQFGCMPGQMKCTYGTGAFLLLNTGMHIVQSSQGLLSTIALKTQFETQYALEGSVYAAGSIVNWLKNQLQIIKHSHDIEKLARKVSENEMKDIMLLPFFTGIGAPYWRAQARAALVGLTQKTSHAHICRAALEGIALSVRDAFAIFLKESPHPIKSMRVDGGASKNNLLMEMQADFLNTPLFRSSVSEGTAYGAAIGCKINLEKLSLSKIAQSYQEERIFSALPHQYHVNKGRKWDQYIQKNFL